MLIEDEQKQFFKENRNNLRARVQIQVDNNNEVLFRKKNISQKT